MLTCHLLHDQYRYNPEKYSSMFCFQHKIQRAKARKNIESCEPRTNYELILL